MTVLIKVFFILYNILWQIGFIFLRFNSRVKDGFEQRTVPNDWLKQKLYAQNSFYINIEKDKYLFCLNCQYKAVDYESLKILPQNIEEFEVKNVDLWLQAASGGEAYLAVDFIKSLPQENRKLNILITTWTRQGMDVLERECAKIFQSWQNEHNAPDLPTIIIRFACFDLDKIVFKAFEQANPKLCIMFETELWPNFMLECKKRKIPLYVINARMTKTSYEFYKIISFILDKIAPKKVLATTKEDMERFAKIFPSSLVRFMPNMKFDRAIDLVKQAKNYNVEQIRTENIENNFENRENLKFSFEKTNSTFFKSNAKTNKNRKFSIKKKKLFNFQKNIKKDDKILNTKKYLEFLPQFFSKSNSVVLFASIRQKEENLLTALLWKIFSIKKKSLFIIVPKHLERAEHWYSRFYDLGMAPVLASEYFKAQNYELGKVNPFEEHQCIVWDIFGDLAKLYTEADYVFVGGSFKNLGGQNFLESIAGGVCPHVGPDLDNFLWAIGKDNPPSLLEKNLVIQHENKRHFKEFLLDFKEEKRTLKEREEVQEEFLDWLMKYHGTSKLVVEEILQDAAL